MITKDWKDYIDRGISYANIPSANHEHFELQIILDILEGCKYQCPGCYVNRRNNYTDSVLDNALKLIEESESAGIFLDDITIGPTDFFGADNIENILRDDRMKSILSKVEGVQHNTSIDPDVDDSFVEKIINVLESFDEYKNLNYDVQIAVDLNKLISSEDYRRLVDERWDTFKNSKLKYEVSLLANIDESALETTEAIKLTEDRWGTVIEYVPSVMRSNKENMKKTIEKWREYRTGYDLHADISHKTFHHMVVNFNKDRAYLSPFIYENAAVYDPAYEVLPNLESVLKATNKITDWQYENAGKTCKSCDKLSQCISHMVPFFTINTLEEEDYCPLNIGGLWKQ